MRGAIGVRPTARMSERRKDERECPTPTGRPQGLGRGVFAPTRKTRGPAGHARTLLPFSFPLLFLFVVTGGKLLMKTKA